MLSARPPRNAEGKRPDSFRHSLSVRPRLRSTEECKERGRGTWSFKSLNPSRRALQFSPPAFSAFLSKLGRCLMYDRVNCRNARLDNELTNLRDQRWQIRLLHRETLKNQRPPLSLLPHWCVVGGPSNPMLKGGNN